VKHGLKECDHIAVVRFDGALIFANATYLEDKVLEYIAEKPDLKQVIITANGINDLDASGEEALAILVETVRSAGLEISFCNLNERCLSVMERTHLIDKIRRENIYPDGQSALKAAYDKIHENGECKGCPLANFKPIQGPKLAHN
jgi:anti-anti-sigma factor